MEYERRVRRGFSPDRFPSNPVEIGKEYDVEIKEISRRGDGIARIQGLVTFIRDTKIGDQARIKITRVSRRFAEAEVVGTAEGGAEETTESKETE